MDHSRESQSDTAPTYEKSDLNYSAATFVFEPHGEMAQIMEQIERFASHDGPVMILGETGTGKEHIAKVIHGLSGVPGPMISINCSAIPADLFENELFGHEKGAYTGAVHSTDGIIGRAENGTIFMDEIGELSLYGQVKILRLIQEKEYEKIGSTRPLKTNARFIFATNRNLEQEIQKGSFRADLYYRISTFEVTLPPLRERKRDIDLLIHHFLWCYSKSLKREIRITDDAKTLLRNYSWPGNVRELENTLLRAAMESENGTIEAEHIPATLQMEEDFYSHLQSLKRMDQERTALEKELIKKALNFSGGNVSMAARLMEISRGALQYKLKQYNLD